MYSVRGIIGITLIKLFLFFYLSINFHLNISSVLYSVTLIKQLNFILSFVPFHFSCYFHSLYLIIPPSC